MTLLHSAVRTAAAAGLLGLALLCLSCASLPRGNKPAREQETVLEFQHAYSRKSSDCLVVCVDMVLNYYGVETSVPDTVLPLDLVTLSTRLNTGLPVDSAGHIVFATVLELAPDEVAAQIEKKRPLIVAFKPNGREEYHSVVVSGYNRERGRFLINDPARSKPNWKKPAGIPTFMDTGKYLVLLVGLRDI